MTKQQQQMCAAASAIVFGFFTMALATASYQAISLVGDPWHAIDYWLVWFSGFTMLGAVGCGLTAGIQFTVAFGCFVERS